MPLPRLLLIATILTLISGLIWWWLPSTPPIAAKTAVAGVVLRSEQSQSSAALRPSVVTAATKLGQGRPAVASMPRVEEFSLPSLRETSAGLALLIPSTPLPAKAAHEFTQPNKATPGASLRLRFDLYSWSEGVLVATANTAVELTTERNLLDVPDALEALRSKFATHTRLLLVLPVGAKGLPSGLNPNDAYIVVAEREPS